MARGEMAIETHWSTAIGPGRAGHTLVWNWIFHPFQNIGGRGLWKQKKQPKSLVQAKSLEIR
jgi:hypothetical protein